MNLYVYANLNPINAIDPFGLYSWYNEFNPFDPSSAMSRKARSIGKAMGGMLALALGDTTTSNLAFQDAASDSGQAILDENCSSSVEYGAYYGVLGISTAAVSGAVALGAIETAVAAGYYKVGAIVTQRHMALMAFGSGVGGRYFSPGQVHHLISNGIRASAWYGKTIGEKVYNFLTTISYGGQGQGEVTLNWIKRTIIHSNPFK